MHLGTMMLQCEQQYADRTALWVDGRAYDYYHLFYHVRRIAAPLSNRQIPRCAIFSTNSIWAYAGVLGSLAAGAVYVPLNLRHPLERLQHVLGVADVGAMILDPASINLGQELLARHPSRLLVILLDCDMPQLRPHHYLTQHQLRYVHSKTHQQDGAYLLFTSGSTGTPKGVLVSHANVLSYLDTIQQRYHLTTQDRCSQLFDLTFDLSVHDMFATWQAGAALYVPPVTARIAPANFIKQHALTCWFGVPSAAATMARLHMLRPNTFPSLRWSLFCGDVLPRSLAAAWAKAAPNSIVENLYGPTEATIAITAYRLPSEIAALPNIVPIGDVFPHHHAVIVDADGNPTEGDGELYVGGPQISLGYWRQPDLTTERFAPPHGDWPDRWYRTGDRVRRSAHGLEFLGRLDRQVKIIGYRVELQEIEDALRHLARNVAALAWPFDGLARGVILFVGDAADDDTLMAACEYQLPAYMVPMRIHRVTEWPLNSNGKTDYVRLRELV